MLSQSHAIFLRQLIRSVTLCTVLLFMCGCDQISGTPVVQIIGEVRMDRKPLADAMVAFIPLELRGSGGKIIEVAFGKTDQTGKFEMRTSEARGVLPGEYRILFFRPSQKLDEPKPTDDALKKLETSSLTDQMPSDASLILGTMNRLSKTVQAMETQSEMVNVGGIPVTYNIQSNLRFSVKPGSGIIYPKFELDGHPKN